MFEIHLSSPQRVARRFASPRDLTKLCKEGRLDAAIQAAELMDQQRIPISKDIIICLLQGCNTKKDLGASRRVHTLMASNGFDSIPYWGDHLIRLFALCEGLVEANQVFCKVSKPSVYTWNAIISAHVKLGEGEKALALYQKMQQEGIEPAKVTFLWLLKACGSIRSVEHGRQIHKHVLRDGLVSDVVVGSTLVDMYCKCGNLEEAHIVFDELPNRNAVTWGAMISGYVQDGHGLLALELFEKMLEQDIEPDVCTFSCILKACGIIKVIKQGRSVHNHIIRNEFESDLVVGSTLVDMYVKCGSLADARKVFDELPKRNVISWGAMIAGYAQHGHGFVALELFEEMQQEGVKPSKVTFSCTLKACCRIEALEQGELLHEQVVKNGYEVDLVVGNTLVDMYAKCGRLEEASKVFDQLPNRNVVSWGAIIFGYAQHGHGGLALQLFKKMQQQGIKPDRVIFLCILKACSNTRSIWEGMHVHAKIIQQRLNADHDVRNALVDMYVKCGRLKEAQSVFDNSPNEDVVSWAVMISGYAQCEDGFSALELFKKMQQASIKPDKFIFSCIVKSCISIGAIEQGRLIHEQIIRSGLEMDVVVGSTLIDMYASCGSMGESCRVFDRLPNRNIMSWGAIIAGYTQNSSCREASQCLKDMQQEGLKPNDVIFTSVLAACSRAGLLEEGCWHFERMQKDHSITPMLAHYSCMIDLLGRAGCIEESKDLLTTMPKPPDAFMWMALLTGCRTYGNIVLGKQCFNELVQLNPKDASGYVLMSNIYGAAQMWNDVDKLQQLRNDASAQKKPGMTWIEVNNKVHEFVVGGTKFSEIDEVSAKLKRLNRLVKKKDYMPKLDLVLEQMSDDVKGNAFDSALRKWLSSGKPRLDQEEL